MRILDQKFRKNLVKYIFQCLLATLAILIILLFLDVLTETAIIASLGATAFIVFTMPYAYSSKTRPLLGGYIVGIIVGITLNTIATSTIITSLQLPQNITIAGFGAISVGIAIFVMVATDTEHPPAAGIALGLIINVWEPTTILYIIIAVILLTSLKKALKPYMLDLL
jgi:CBS-domain-containing membrane protein